MQTSPKLTATCESDESWANAVHRNPDFMQRKVKKKEKRKIVINVKWEKQRGSFFLLEIIFSHSTQNGNMAENMLTKGCHVLQMSDLILNTALHQRLVCQQLCHFLLCNLDVISSVWCDVFVWHLGGWKKLVTFGLSKHDVRRWGGWGDNIKIYAVLSQSLGKWLLMLLTHLSQLAQMWFGSITQEKKK